MDGFGRRNLLIYYRYTELDNWKDSDVRPWLCFIDGRSGTADEDGPVKILTCGRRWTAGQMDVIRPWWPEIKTIYHNLFFSVLDNLTFISINSLKR